MPTDEKWRASHASDVGGPGQPGRLRLSWFPVVTSIVALALATLPYVIGYFSTHQGLYCWAGTSVSDFCVYLAWIRASADGSWRDPHLFAGGRSGMPINPVYWLLGILSRATALSGFAVYHLGRVAFGAALLYVLWRFVKMCTADGLTRRLAFLFLCFSSGFGWFLGHFLRLPGSIDQWQPEAFTFLSLYTYPHFCVALTLQVAILACLLKSETTGRMTFAVAAGILGSLLAIEHTYDLLTVFAVWLMFATSPAMRTWRARQGGREWAANAVRRQLIAGALTLPGVAYIALAFHSDRVFAARAGEPTLSFSPASVLFGYGGIFVLAVIGIWVLGQGLRNYADHADDSAKSVDPVGPSVAGVTVPTAWLLIVWSVVNLLMNWAPVLFQRKLIQGEHVVLCLLAAMGASYGLRRMFPRRDWSRLGLPEVALAALLAIGSGVYLWNDTRDIIGGREQGMYRSSLLAGEVAALDWVRQNTPSNSLIQPLPWVHSVPQKGVKPFDETLALFVPGMTGRAVYCGHWAETPNYDAHLADIMTLATPSSGNVGFSTRQQQVLRETRINYIVFSQKSDPTARSEFSPILSPNEPGQSLLGRRPMFQLVYGNSQADVYRVIWPTN